MLEVRIDILCGPFYFTNYFLCYSFLMEEKILQKLEEQDGKIDGLVEDVSKMRKYFAWMFWLTIAFFVLPLIAAVFVLPSFLSSYMRVLDGFI